LVRKISTFYINDVLLFKSPFPGQRFKKDINLGILGEENHRQIKKDNGLNRQNKD